MREGLIRSIPVIILAGVGVTTVALASASAQTGSNVVAPGVSSGQTTTSAPELSPRPGNPNSPRMNQPGDPRASIPGTVGTDGRVTSSPGTPSPPGRKKVR